MAVKHSRNRGSSGSQAANRSATSTLSRASKRVGPSYQGHASWLARACSNIVRAGVGSAGVVAAPRFLSFHTCAPRPAFAPHLNIVAVQRRDGDEGEVLLWVVACRLEEGREAAHDVVVALLAPLPPLTHHAAVVQLVDYHEQLHNAQRLRQLRVLAGLQRCVCVIGGRVRMCTGLLLAMQGRLRALRERTVACASPPARPSQSRSRTPPCGC